jgi:hypothetical protein
MHISYFSLSKSSRDNKNLKKRNMSNDKLDDSCALLLLQNLVQDTLSDMELYKLSDFLSLSNGPFGK